MPGAAPLAFIVTGLLLNGKPSMTSIVGSTIGGYAALYAQLGNATSSAVSAETEWTTVSSTLETLTRAGEARTGHQELQGTLITGFDMFKAAGSRHAALQAAGSRMRSSSAQHDFKPYRCVNCTACYHRESCSSCEHHTVTALSTVQAVTDHTNSSI